MKKILPILTFVLLLLTSFIISKEVIACTCTASKICDVACGSNAGISCESDPECIFGKITPPKGSPTDPSIFLGRVINLFILVMALFMLMYMLWGAFDWITSSGEKEKMDKARDKITQAVLGMFVAIVVLTLFNVLVGPIFGLTEKGGIIFKLPHLGP